MWACAPASSSVLTTGVLSIAFLVLVSTRPSYQTARCRAVAPTNSPATLHTSYYMVWYIAVGIRYHYSHNFSQI